MLLCWPGKIIDAPTRRWRRKLALRDKYAFPRDGRGILNWSAVSSVAASSRQHMAIVQATEAVTPSVAWGPTKEELQIGRSPSVVQDNSADYYDFFRQSSMYRSEKRGFQSLTILTRIPIKRLLKS
jgi:hypothetical protein